MSIAAHLILWSKVHVAESPLTPGPSPARGEREMEMGSSRLARALISLFLNLVVVEYGMPGVPSAHARSGGAGDEHPLLRACSAILSERLSALNCAKLLAIFKRLKTKDLRKNGNQQKTAKFSG